MKTILVNFHGEQVPLPFTDDGRCLCPVCAFSGGTDNHPWGYRAWDGTWHASPGYYDCGECATWFGMSDVKLEGETMPEV